MTQRLSSSEELLRAICEPHHFDPKHKRASTRLFRGREVSLNRLKVWAYDQICSFYNETLTTPSKKFIGTAKLTCGDIEQVGNQHDLELYVVEDANRRNPSHAIIPVAISSRKIAYSLLKRCEFHYVSQITLTGA